MAQTKRVDRKTFWWSAFIVFFVFCVIDSAVWLGLRFLENATSPLYSAGEGLSEVTKVIQTFYSFEQWVFIYALPGTFILFLMTIGLLYLLLRSDVASDEPQPIEKKGRSDSESAEIRAENRIKDQRLFLHLISLLQREGRLIDFFAEDLSSFDDAQIGGAVREIHSTCRKVIEKSLSLKPVIDNIEGETVSIQPGFDPGAVKLIGNVTGEPPFSGILRHRGWQAGKLEMPTLSSTRDPNIIYSAEVEIQ